MFRIRIGTAPDPALFVSDIQDANKKYFFLIVFAYYFLKLHLHHSVKMKSRKKKSQNSRYKGFSYYISLMKEGSESLHLINGSGSARPKNVVIRNSAF